MANKNFTISLPELDYDEIVKDSARGMGWADKVRTGNPPVISDNPVEPAKWLAEKLHDSFINYHITAKTRSAASSAAVDASAKTKEALEKKFKIK